MEDTTKKMLVTVGAGIAKKVLMLQAAGLVSHGIISSNETETYVSLGMAAVGAAWSFWDDFGRAIVLSQFEVWKAKSLAQAAKMKAAGLAQPTVSEIAAQHPKLTPADVAKVASTIVKILLVAFVLSTFLMSGSAMAQGKAVPKPRPAAASAVDPLQKLMDDITAKEATFVTGVIGALNEADADAATLINPSDPTSFRDPISHACYPAQIKFLQSLPQIQEIKAPAPYNAIVLFQRKRDLVAEIKAGLPPYLKVGCSALLQDEKTIFVQTLGLIGVGAGAGILTGLFPAAAPLTIPGLTFPAIVPLVGG